MSVQPTNKAVRSGGDGVRVIENASNVGDATRSSVTDTTLASTIFVAVLWIPLQSSPTKRALDRLGALAAPALSLSNTPWPTASHDVWANVGAPARRGGGWRHRWTMVDGEGK